MHSSSPVVGAAASGRLARKYSLRTAARQTRAHAGEAAVAFGLFLLTFVRWFGIPSPFAAAFLLALPGKPSFLCLLGLGGSLGFRLISGVEMDIWQFAGCAGLWLILQKCRPRAGVETAALGGLAMMPRILAALVADMPLQILLSCAALPVCMFSSVVLRCGVTGVYLAGAALDSRERGCLYFLSLLIFNALGYFWMGPVNMGQMAALLAVLVFAAANGPVQGVAGGCFAGLALALGGHDARVMLALSLCGLLGGLPPVVHMRWLLIPSVCAAQAVAWFVTQMEALPLGLCSGIAGTLACVLLRSRLLEKFGPYLRSSVKNERTMENAFVTQRIEHMRAAIENLARALPEWPEESLSPGQELGEVLCAQCINRELCWGRSRNSTEKMLDGMVELSARGEKISEDNLPALAAHGCMRAESAYDAAQDMLRHQKKRRAAQHKARYEHKLTLTHLAALSGTLQELGRMAAGESLNDLRSAHLISLALEELHVPARLSYARRVDGHLQAELIAETMMPVQKPLDQLLRALAAEDMPLAVSRMEKGRIELEEIPLYSATVGMASLCAQGADGVCGDACSAKRCEGGRLLMMLCDGMGHGEAARQQSEKTLELLMLLLEAGYTRHQAITAVNGIMLGAQAEERFSTVDLADVDLWTGDVYGEKLGACASWVVRGSHMKKVEGSSLPLGILQEAQPTAAQYRLHSGDILILMSDGVADALGDDVQTRKIIAESLFIQPQRMADALLRNALVAGGGAPKDDMTVMVMLLMDRRRV